MRRNNLFYIIPGQREHRLVPHAKAEFKLDGLPGYSVEFILDDQAVVLRMLFKESAGIFIAPRIPEVIPN